MQALFIWLLLVSLQPQPPTASHCGENDSLLFVQPHNHIYLKHCHIKWSIIPLSSKWGNGYLCREHRIALQLPGCSFVFFPFFPKLPLAGCFVISFFEQQMMHSAQRQHAQGTYACHLVQTHIQIVVVTSVSRWICSLYSENNESCSLCLRSQLELFL